VTRGETYPILIRSGDRDAPSTPFFSSSQFPTVIQGSTRSANDKTSYSVTSGNGRISANVYPQYSTSVSTNACHVLQVVLNRAGVLAIADSIFA